MTDTMRAVRFHGKGDIRIEEVEIPKCRSRDVLLKPAFVGLCGTDVHEYLEGAFLIPTESHPVTGEKAPVIIGHEYSGTVSKVGDGVDDLKPGDRVVVQPIIFDGTCSCCQRGLINSCSNSGFLGLSGIGGGLAEYTTVPRYSIFKLPDNVSLRVAALVEPFAVAWHAVNMGGFQRGYSALVLGAGPIGLAITMVLKSRGASQIIVSEVAEKRRQFAARFGATAVLNPIDDDIIGFCKQTCDDGVQLVFDCAGIQSTLDTALAASRAQAVIVNVAVWTGDATFSPNFLLQNERTYRGSATYTTGDFEEVIDAISQGRLDPEPMITSVIELGDTEEKGLKTLIHNKDSQVKILVKI